VPLHYPRPSGHGYQIGNVYSSASEPVRQEEGGWKGYLDAYVDMYRLSSSRGKLVTRENKEKRKKGLSEVEKVRFE
jgi:hypothetical protein